MNMLEHVDIIRAHAEFSFEGGVLFFVSHKAQK